MSNSLLCDEDIKTHFSPLEKIQIEIKMKQEKEDLRKSSGSKPYRSFWLDWKLPAKIWRVWQKAASAWDARPGRFLIVRSENKTMKRVYERFPEIL